MSFNLSTIYSNSLGCNPWKRIPVEQTFCNFFRDLAAFHDGFCIWSNEKCTFFSMGQYVGPEVYQKTPLLDEHWRQTLGRRWRKGNLLSNIIMFMFYTDWSSRGVGNVFFSSFSLFLFEFFDCDQKSTRVGQKHLPYQSTPGDWPV